MSIKVSELEDIISYQNLKKSDKILISQEEYNKLVTKNVYLSSLELYLSNALSSKSYNPYSPDSPDGSPISGYALIGHTHLISDITDLSDYKIDSYEDIKDFNLHTHTIDQITDFDTHKHVMSEITDLSNQTHEMSDITDLSNQTHKMSDIVDLSNQTHEMSDITDLSNQTHTMSEITDLSNQTHQMSDIIDLKDQKHIMADISDLSNQTHYISDIVDFDEHRHEISDVNNLTSYINEQISGFSVPRIYYLRDTNNITLSSNTIVVVEQTKVDTVGISDVKKCEENEQRHFYLYIINKLNDNVLITCPSVFNFRSYDPNALSQVPASSEVLLEFIELNVNSFFVIRHSSEVIIPQYTRSYIVSYPYCVDEYHELIGNVEIKSESYTQGFEFEIPEVSEIDGYVFDYWFDYDNGDIDLTDCYQPGDKVTIKRDTKFYAVYNKNKYVSFCDQDNMELLRKYRIEKNSKIYLISDDQIGYNEEVEKMEYPKSTNPFIKYIFNQTIPDLRDIHEDIIITYDKTEIPHKDEDVDGIKKDDDGGIDEIVEPTTKDGEETDLSNILFLKLDDNNSEDEENTEIPLFAISDDMYITII